MRGKQDRVSSRGGGGQVPESQFTWGKKGDKTLVEGKGQRGETAGRVSFGSPPPVRSIYCTMLIQ